MFGHHLNVALSCRCGAKFYVTYGECSGREGMRENSVKPLDLQNDRRRILCVSVFGLLAGTGFAISIALAEVLDDFE